jgi:hypothetical protein
MQKVIVGHFRSPKAGKSAYFTHPDFSAGKLKKKCANYRSKYGIYHFQYCPFGAVLDVRPETFGSYYVSNINYCRNLSGSSRDLTWGRMANTSVPCRHFMRCVRRTNLTNSCNAASVNPKSVYAKLSYFNP